MRLNTTFSWKDYWEPSAFIKSDSEGIIIWVDRLASRSDVKSGPQLDRASVLKAM